MLLTCLVTCAMHTVFAQASKKTYTIIVLNASLVDVGAGKIIPKRLIAISGDTIKVVTDMANAKQYRALHYVDAKGKCVMPGLWDSHVHFRGGSKLVDANKAMLPIFLAYGITTVRECGGDMTTDVMDWRKQISAGTLAGPRIFTSGPKIDGPRATWAGSLEVTTPEQVSKALDSLQKIHTDFVKIYDSTIPRDAYLETIVKAEKRGLITTGHMPFSVKLTEAIDRGLDGTEHLYYLFKACSAKEDSVTQVFARAPVDRPLNLFTGLPALYDSFDQAKADRLFKYMAEKHVSVTPTLAISKTLDEIKEADHSTDTLLQYIDPKVVETYQGRINSAKRASASSTEFQKKLAAKMASLVPQLYKAGVNIVAGSDCGASNAYTYPGQALHQELKEMVAVGLTPAQALKTATVNGSKLLRVESFYGNLSPGKCADMIIVDANPLADISAVDHIYTLIAHHKVYTKTDLQGLMNGVKH